MHAPCPVGSLSDVEHAWLTLFHGNPLDGLRAKDPRPVYGPPTPRIVYTVADQVARIPMGTWTDDERSAIAELREAVAQRRAGLSPRIIRSDVRYGGPTGLSHRPFADASDVAWQACGGTTAAVDAVDAHWAHLDYATDGMLDSATALAWHPVAYLSRREALEARRIARKAGRTRATTDDITTALAGLADAKASAIGHASNSPGRRLGAELDLRRAKASARRSREITRAHASGKTLAAQQAEQKAARTAKGRETAAARAEAARRRKAYEGLVTAAAKLDRMLAPVAMPTADHVADAILTVQGLAGYETLPASVRSGHSRSLRALRPTAGAI